MSSAAPAVQSSEFREIGGKGSSSSEQLTHLSEFLVLHLEGQEGTLQELLGGGTLVRVVAQQQSDHLLLV